MSTVLQSLPKRILMTADAVGGVWRYAIVLARRLADDGIETALATMGGPLTAVQEAEAGSIRGLRLFQSSWKLEWMPDPWDDVARAGEWLLEIEREIRPDLVHLNGFCHGALSWQNPAIVVGHSCVLSWWRAVNGGPLPSEWKPYRDAVLEGMRAARLVIAPSQTMLRALQEHYGPFIHATAIFNGLPAGEFSPRRKSQYILAAGRVWDEAKNLSSLAAVAPRLPWPVYIAGEHRNPAEAFPKQNEPQPPRDGDIPGGKPVYTGRLDRDDLKQWFERASIYALPARYEPFGFSVLEAAQAGCALVLGDIASLREIWGNAARFVPPNDHAALEKTLLELSEDPGEVVRLAEKARRTALAYTADRMAAEYRLAYSQVLQRRIGPTHRKRPPRPVIPSSSASKGAATCVS